MVERYTLSPVDHQQLLSPDPEAQAEVERRIDLFFNTPLDIFPFAETKSKPDRFHVFYGSGIQERFPDDEDVRGLISGYGRSFFRSMLGYMFVKRLLQVLTLAAVSALLVFGPGLAENAGIEGIAATAAVAGGMLLAFLIYVGVSALIFTQYRIDLENRSYELSRVIIQRTRELQNPFVTVKALPDQAETQYPDADSWGARANYLTRLLVWVGQRMEYLERYLQMDMWRLRRERYWMSWGGGILVVLISIGWLVWLALLRAPAEGEAMFRVLQAVTLLFGGLIGFSSYAFWQTPENLAKDRLGSEGWVRYASLDLDNALGDQVRRDKERIVEYRTLNKR